MRFRNDERGFTLLELMICLGLLALLALAALRASGQGMLAFGQAQERSAALDYAIAITEELRAAPALLTRAGAGALTAAEQRRLLADPAMEAELEVRRTNVSAYIELPAEAEDAALYAVSLRVWPRSYPGAVVEWEVLLHGEEAGR